MIVACPALLVAVIWTVWVVMDAIAVGKDSPRPLSVSAAELESIVSVDGMSPEATAAALDITVVGMEFPES